MTKNGCWNRPPLKDTVIVQDGWRNGYTNSRMPLMTEIPDHMSKNCVYGRDNPNDPKCEGCKELEL